MSRENAPVVVTAEVVCKDEGDFADLGLTRIWHGFPIDYKDPGM